VPGDRGKIGEGDLFHAKKGPVSTHGEADKRGSDVAVGHGEKKRNRENDFRGPGTGVSGRRQISKMTGSQNGKGGGGRVREMGMT